MRLRIKQKALFYLLFISSGYAQNMLRPREDSSGSVVLPFIAWNDENGKMRTLEKNIFIRQTQPVSIITNQSLTAVAHVEEKKFFKPFFEPMKKSAVNINPTGLRNSVKTPTSNYRTTGWNGQESNSNSKVNNLSSLGSTWATSTALLLIPQSLLLTWNYHVNYKPWTSKKISSGFGKIPKYDHNTFTVNYVLHPLKDGNAYLLIRNNGGSPFLSELFAVYEVLLWEYVGEGWYASPSRTDLLTGLVSPLIYGETVHQLTMLMEKNGMNLAEKIIVIIINPFYMISHRHCYKRQNKPIEH